MIKALDTYYNWQIRMHNNYDNGLIVLRTARGNSLNGNHARVHVSQFTVVLLTRQKCCVQQQDTLVALHVWATESSQKHTNIHPLDSGQNKHH